MGILDRLFNTYSKRLYILTIVLAGFYLVNLTNNFKIGVAISNLKSVDEIFSIVDNPIIRKTFVGHLLINYLDNGYGVLKVFLTSFGIYRLLGFVVVILFLTSKLPTKMTCVKAFSAIGITVIVLQYMTIIYVGISALGFSNPVLIMNSIHTIGKAFIYFSIAEIVFTLFSVFLITYELLN